MPKIDGVTPQYHEGWLNALDGRTEVAQRMRHRFKSQADGFGNSSNLTHQHKSFITRIRWLEHWLEQQESQLATRRDFKAGQWIQGTNALIGLYSRLEEITKHTQKMRPITINVVKPEDSSPEVKFSKR